MYLTTLFIVGYLACVFAAGHLTGYIVRERQGDRATWIPIKNFPPNTPVYQRFDVWMRIGATPWSFGWSDQFRVADCWSRDGKWFHTYRDTEAEFATHYITHFKPEPKGPF